MVVYRKKKTQCNWIGGEKTDKTRKQTKLVVEKSVSKGTTLHSSLSEKKKGGVKKVVVCCVRHCPSS